MTEDLSKRHNPVSRLISIPDSPDEWAKYRLSPEQVEFYEDNGYLSGVRILSEEQVDVLCEQLAGLLDPEAPGHELFHEYHSNESSDPDKVLFHALGAWRIAPAFHDILWNPAFTVAASQLLGGSVRFWHDQLFCKPAHHGGVVAWHQDYSYWTRTKPIQHLTCFIALDDCTTENGCMHYAVGTHRWELLPITGLADNMEAIYTVLDAEQKRDFEPVPIELKKGCASFHHPLLIHGSYENRSDRNRRATVINVFRDGIRSASDQPPLKGVPPVPNGEPMDGQFFPLLLDVGQVGVGAEH